MQDAATLLTIIRERSQQGKPLTNAYRMLYNPSLYLYAYGRISGNAGALTPGVTGETVDGMSLAKIQAIIARLRQETYRWKPVRRVYIPKPSGKTRPLGIPDWSDKLVQEVIRLILEAHYEPRFSARSHGFRPGHGCHTALAEAVETWTGTKWFIEGDITGCFDNIDHAVLLAILGETIHDNRFLRLIRQMLQAGYLEHWVYGHTLSGTPQGGVGSPILANIYLDRLDQFVEHALIPAYTRGERRRPNLAYQRLTRQIATARRGGDRTTMRLLALSRRRMPSVDPTDPTYRRLRYVRYADDFLLGFIGAKAEAEEIKRLLRDFLHGTLRLELSEQKTRITHATTQAARFLGYELVVQRRNDYRTHGSRKANGRLALRLPVDRVEALRREYVANGKPRRHLLMLHESDYDIVARFGSAYRGYYNYYQLATNVCWLNRVRFAMERSLLHTLARKHHSTVRKEFARLRTRVPHAAGAYTCLQVQVPRAGKPPLVAQFGGFPLRRVLVATLPDHKPFMGPRITRNDKMRRLLHEACELCGAKGPVEGHHIRKLADLTKHGRNPPPWVRLMAARRRKTLYVCASCHDDITYGRRPARAVVARTEFTTGEPDDAKVSRPVRRGADGKVRSLDLAARQ